jgi:hypothetical protein
LKIDLDLDLDLPRDSCGLRRNSAGLLEARVLSALAVAIALPLFESVNTVEVPLQALDARRRLAFAGLAQAH